MTAPIVVEVKNSKMNIARNSLKDGVNEGFIKIERFRINLLTNFHSQHLRKFFLGLVSKTHSNWHQLLRHRKWIIATFLHSSIRPIRLPACFIRPTASSYVLDISIHKSVWIYTVTLKIKVIFMPKTSHIRPKKILGKLIRKTFYAQHFRSHKY